MLSSVLSHDDQDELLNGACANIGLIGDTIWAPRDRDDPYRKLNRTLWIRSCKIAANYAALSAGARPKKKRVRDVIPESRLATYGDFEYKDGLESSSCLFLARGIEAENSHDDEEEADDEDGDKVVQEEAAPTATINGDGSLEDEGSLVDKEPWMLDEVEQLFARITQTATVKRRRPAKESLLKCDGTSKESQNKTNHVTSFQEEKKKSSPGEETSEASREVPVPPRFRVTNVSEAQLQGRIFSDAVRNLWRSPSPVPTGSGSGQRPPQLARGLRHCHSELQRELGLMRPSQQQQQQQQKRGNDMQQTHSSFQNERLRMPSRCQYSYVQAINVVHRPLAPLCVDVPEFFPKGPGTWPIEEHASKPLQFYPVSADNPYQEEVFPYKGQAASRKTVTVYQNTVVPMVPTPIVSAMVWPSQGWTTHQRILPTPIQLHQMPPPSCTTMAPLPQAPTPQPMPMQQAQAGQSPGQAASQAPTIMCPVVHRPIRIQEPQVGKQQQQQQPGAQQQVFGKGRKPAPIPVYQRPSKPGQDYQQRRKSQGVDFNNLILLTKSAMKVRRNQSKGSKKPFIDAGKMQTVGSGAVGGVKPDARWFEKGSQPKREREYLTVTTTMPRLSSVSRSDSGSCRELLLETSDSCRGSEEDAAETPETPSRKRLYRDVLENNSSTPSPAATQDVNSSERRYDELERQAMEQYRNSEECLALRYQELEQQALEQYRNAESSESINALEADCRQPRSDGDIVDEEQQPQPSGFGRCNLGKKAPAADERGNELQQQRIKILKAESRTGAAVATPPVHRAASEGSLQRPIAVAKRLAAISGSGAAAGYARESKNTIRGASREKIVKTSSLSSLKRRLMPMSPLDRNRSGASLMKNANIDPMKAVQTLDKHVAAYYRNTKVIQTGSGDDKSNNGGVWLTDFWS